VALPSSYSPTYTDVVYGPNGLNSTVGSLYSSANLNNKFNLFYPDTTVHPRPRNGWPVVVQFFVAGYTSTARATSLLRTIDPVYRSHWLTLFLDAGFAVVSASTTLANQSDAFAVTPGAGVSIARGAFKRFAPVTAHQWAQDHFVYKDASNLIGSLRAGQATYNLDPERIITFGASAGGATGLWGAFGPDMGGYAKNPIGTTEEKKSSWYGAVQTRANGAIAVNPQSWYPYSNLDKVLSAGDYKFAIWPNGQNGSQEAGYSLSGVPTTMGTVGGQPPGSYDWDAGSTVRQFSFLGYAFRRTTYFYGLDHVQANMRTPVYMFSDRKVGAPKSVPTGASPNQSAYTAAARDFSDERLDDYNETDHDAWTPTTTTGYPKNFSDDDHDGWHVVAAHRALLELNRSFHSRHSRLVLTYQEPFGQNATYTTDGWDVAHDAAEWLRQEFQ
jgi:hypothetical protein